MLSSHHQCREVVKTSLVCVLPLSITAGKRYSQDQINCWVRPPIQRSAWMGGQTRHFPCIGIVMVPLCKVENDNHSYRLDYCIL
jgi:hypothetical protein